MTETTESNCLLSFSSHPNLASPACCPAGIDPQRVVVKLPCTLEGATYHTCTSVFVCITFCVVQNILCLRHSAKEAFAGFTLSRADWTHQGLSTASSYVLFELVANKFKQVILVQVILVQPFLAVVFFRPSNHLSRHKNRSAGTALTQNTGSSFCLSQCFPSRWFPFLCFSDSLHLCFRFAPLRVPSCRVLDWPPCVRITTFDG